MAALLIFVACLAVCSAEFADDLQSYEPACLVEGAFSCLGGGCVAHEKYCDGRYDCEDGSDENFCTNHRPDAQYCNETHQFLCADGRKCIPSAWVCNYENECDDGTDEVNCTAPIELENSTCKGFLCDEGSRCISWFWICDGHYDCEDKSDEDILDTCHHKLSQYTNNLMGSCEFRSPNYTCLDGSYCMEPKYMCDGMMDCRDGSDEGDFCRDWHTMCTNMTCPPDSFCKAQRTGVTCVCDSYKVYNATTGWCEEVNHCLVEWPPCSHMCHEMGEVFKCSCDDGYVMDFASYLCFAPDPEAMLFFSTRNDIRYIKIKSKQQVTVATGIKQAHGVSYDGNYLYWVETAEGHQAIMRARLDDVAGSRQVIAALGVEEPGDIALDFVGDNIFFSDAARGVITACRSDGALCSTIRARTRNPRFVTLDPKNGIMYWADWFDKPVIMKAWMDGSEPQVLTDQLGSFATGLALDAPNGRLYFVDRTIKVVIVDDGRVYTFLDEPFHHPYALAVFENTVFWSDWTSSSIATADKIHGTKIHRNVLLNLGVPVFDMHLYHPVLMNRTREKCARCPCAMCIPSARSCTCACPDTMQLMGDHCQQIPGYRPQYLIVGAGSTFSRVHYSTVGNPETHGTHFDIGRVQAMAYDNVRDTLYVYDNQRKSINSISMSDFSLGVTRLFLYSGFENVVDMDYDYASDTLYVLDAERRLIEVISVKTKQRAIVYSFRDQEIPISLCVLPEYGKMLVAIVESEENNEIHVDSFGLDGEGREHVLLNNLLGPYVRLRYSPEADVVYVSDEGNGIIDTVHPEGTGRENFREVLTMIASLAVTDTHVFWTDRRTPRLYWADVHEATHKTRRIELTIFPNLTHLHVLATSPPPKSDNPLLKHTCSQPTNPCSHVCVQTPHPNSQENDTITMGYKCLCPPGFVIDNDICLRQVRCENDEFYCHKSNGCFTKSKKCDGVKDCKYGEDEEGCIDTTTQSPLICSWGQINCHGTCIGNREICRDNKTPAASTCSPMQFQCEDSALCIERALACDGHADCTDASDEHPDACDTRSCFSTEFMCATGSCIPITWRCDRSEDCIDGSDEIGCENKTCPDASFQCSDGTCMELYKRCDGKYDCQDHADEDDCDLPEVLEITEQPPTCLAWEYTCEHNKSMCLPLTARCNTKVECPGGTDEDGCDYRCVGDADLFACKQEYRCVRRKHVCNGRRDCSDGSDETVEACAVGLCYGCNTKVKCLGGTDEGGCDYRCAGDADLFVCKQEYRCVSRKHVCNGRRNCSDGPDETVEACAVVNKTFPLHVSIRRNSSCAGYQCLDGQCVEWRQVCDEHPDCADGSDENGLCATPCQWDTCSHSCHRSPRGPQCACPRGFVAHGAACADVDECAGGPCAHACHNLPGSFVCSCHRGYALRPDRRSCKALSGKLSITYISGSAVWSMTNHMHSAQYHDPEEHHLSDLDVDVRREKIYAVSSSGGKLIEINRADQNTVFDVITNVGRPNRVAVDWVTGNVYFVDSTPGASSMRVCHFSRKRCARLQKLPSEAEVTALAVDPAHRLLFYCLSQGLEAVVRAAGLAGRGGAELAALTSCSGLVADSFTSTLYIASEDPSEIRTVRYDGNELRTIFSNNKHVHSPHDLALFEDHIYFLSGTHLGRCLTFGPHSCEVFGHLHNASHFVVRHESVQRDDVDNDCDGFLCSNVCVLELDAPVCVCHDGALAADGACPMVKTSELALFNGWSYQEQKTHALTLTLVTVILLLFTIYICVVVHYNLVKKKHRPSDYMQVRFHNTPEGLTALSHPIIDMQESGGMAHEFVNPLQFVRNIWQESFYKKRPVGTAGLVFDTQQDLSDTESDLDVRESKRMICERYK